MGYLDRRMARAIGFLSPPGACPHPHVLELGLAAPTMGARSDHVKGSLTGSLSQFNRLVQQELRRADSVILIAFVRRYGGRWDRCINFAGFLSHDG